MARISSLTFLGTAGRRRLRDLHRQKIRKPARCHFRKVSGLTITSTSCQLKNRANTTTAIRNAGVACRDLALRSRNSASCLRRNGFSETKAARGMNKSPMNVSNSAFYKDLQALRSRSEKGRAELMRRTAIHPPRQSQILAACIQIGGGKYNRSGARYEQLRARRW